MYKFFISVLFLSFILKFSYSQRIETISELYFECFSDTMKFPNGKPCTCEPSTFVIFNNEFLMANDKAMPENKSSIFVLTYTPSEFVEYYDNPLFYKVEKYEASTKTPDNKFFVFSGAFDYSENDPKYGKTHNTVIYFQSNDFSKGGILHFGDDTASNSVDIRLKIKNALKSDEFPNGPEYFKVEGLSIIPGNKMIFGIREIGDKYDDFEYKVIMLMVDYKIENDKIKLVGDFTEILDFKPDEKLKISNPIGISSIEYNLYDQKLYFVTSYELSEDSKGRGAYLWSIKIKDLLKGKNPKIITNTKNEILDFKHKIEGIEFYDKFIYLLADDDRVTGENEDNPKFRRKLNQSCIILLIKE